MLKGLSQNHADYSAERAARRKNGITFQFVTNTCKIVRREERARIDASVEQIKAVREQLRAVSHGSQRLIREPFLTGPVIAHTAIPSTSYLILSLSVSKKVIRYTQVITS